MRLPPWPKQIAGLDEGFEIVRIDRGDYFFISRPKDGIDVRVSAISCAPLGLGRRPISVSIGCGITDVESVVEVAHVWAINNLLGSPLTRAPLMTYRGVEREFVDVDVFALTAEIEQRRGESISVLWASIDRLRWPDWALPEDLPAGLLFRQVVREFLKCGREIHAPDMAACIDHARSLAGHDLARLDMYLMGLRATNR